MRTALRNPRGDTVLHLRLAGNPGAFETPQRVSVLIGGADGPCFDVSSPEMADHEIPLSAADFGDDLETTLTGIRVYNVFLAPR